MPVTKRGKKYRLDKGFNRAKLLGQNPALLRRAIEIPYSESVDRWGMPVAESVAEQQNYFHGSTEKFSKFDAPRSGKNYGVGIYLTADPDEAIQYSLRADQDGWIYSIRPSVSKVFDVHSKMDADKIRREMERRGFKFVTSKQYDFEKPEIWGYEPIDRQNWFWRLLSMLGRGQLAIDELTNEIYTHFDAIQDSKRKWLVVRDPKKLKIIKAQRVSFGDYDFVGDPGEKKYVKRLRSESLDRWGMPQLEEANQKPIGEAEYRGEHQAPGREGGAPLHAVSPDIYPEDIYSSDGARYYGDSGGDANDRLSVGVIQSCKGRQNASVKVYRAIPKVITREDKIADLQAQKKYIQKHGKIPPHVSTRLGKSEYYDKIYNELIELENAPPSQVEQSIEINAGDWVTINRNYAKEHGQSNLNGQYKILTKTVKARDLFTDGNSVHEWGYDPAIREDSVSDDKADPLGEDAKKFKAVIHFPDGDTVETTVTFDPEDVLVHVINRDPEVFSQHLGEASHGEFLDSDDLHVVESYVDEKDEPDSLEIIDFLPRHKKFQLGRRRIEL